MTIQVRWEGRPVMTVWVSVNCIPLSKISTGLL